MNNPNPFVPQGSVLEQNKRRSRMKLAVFCVLAVSVAGLSAMLIQGCKKEQENPPTPPVEPALVDTSAPPAIVSTGAPPVAVATSAPPAVYTPPVAPVAPEVPAASEYTVVKGDTLGKIAKNNHVSLKALEDANPKVQPTKLKVGQKLTLPSGGAAAPAATGAATATETGVTSTGGGETYVVKSGDTLTKIAKAHGVSLKALEAANPKVDPAHIKVGHKLQIPAKAESAAPAATPVEAPAPAAAPVAPAPAATPTGQ